MSDKLFRDRLRGLLAKLPIKRFRDPAPAVSVLRLDGVIGRAGIGRSGLTLDGVARQIDRAFAGDDTQAVALAVNSPGGSPVQSALIAGRIRQMAEEKDIPVVAFVEDVAASGGYWLACAGDEIFADPNSVVGSIGVISAGFGFPSLIARVGIERRVYAAGDNKAMLDPFKPEDEEDVSRLKALQEDIHANFKDHVRARRGDRLKGADEDLFEGDIWTGTRGLEMGLIDGLGDLRSIMRERYGDRVRFRDVSDRKGLLRRRLGLGSSVEDLPAQMIGALDEWAVWRRTGL